MINFSIIVIMDVVCSAARNTGTEKRTLKTILIICLVLVTAAFAAGQVYSRVVTDTVPPVITLDSDSITVSVEDGRDALLRGVTASDAKDGDLTGQIIVSGVSKLISNNTAKVSYMVFDKAGNMASATRYVVYSDYHRPHFMLITPLVYSLGETVSITGRLQAQDAVDGDITSSIRVLSSDIISSTEGVYNLTLQVINSLGDTAQVTLPVTIRASSEELRGYSGGIKAKLVENSNFVVVTSESGSQREAFLALVALKDNFDTISDYISSNIVAQVIQEPRVSSSPVNSMNVRRTAMKAALIGAVLMAAAIVAISVMSETVQTRSGAKSLIDAPVIAMLGHEKGARKKKRRGAGAILINSPAVSLAYTEQINSLCSRIEHEKREKGGGIVLVTSVGANEGKSTVAANIAISLASRGYKVALIDTDLRNPSQTELFGGRWSSPLPFNKMLAKPFSVEALNTCAKYDVDTNVMMLFSQYSDERCTELLSSETMRRSIERLRRLDFVVIDTPPMGMFPDAELLCDMADQSMLVVRQDTIPAADINDCVDALNNSSAHFLGCVLNDMRGSSGYGYGYGYGRGYGYGKKYGYYGNYKKEAGSADGRMNG